MMQESVYCRLAQNSTMADAIVENIRKNKPADGLVQVLKITRSNWKNGIYCWNEKKRNSRHRRKSVII